MTAEAMWAAFEDSLARLGAGPQASWCPVAELFGELQQGDRDH
jgi:hypothetical protein